MMSLEQCARWLTGGDDFLIITHRRPDGDALGSACALCRGLRELGKTAWVLRNPETTDRYIQWVEEYFAPADYTPKLTVAVDLADTAIIQLNGTDLINNVDLAIDHHPSNTHYAGSELVMAERASCGEIIYLLLSIMNGGIDEKTALLLYIAVSTDTGCFRYKNTTADTLRVGAALLDAGAPIDLNRVLFMKKQRSRLALESMIIGSLDYFMDGEAVVGVITAEMMEKAGVGEDDMEDIASVTGQIAGVETAVTVRQGDGDEWKISVRTSQYGNASAICAEFGGGGHAMASGGSIRGSQAHAVETVKLAVEKHWKEQ